MLLAALDANLVACREVAKHFGCPYGTGTSITPDGVMVLVRLLDVVVVGTGDKAQETARRKRFGLGSLGALERAKRARAATWDRVRLAEEDGSMGRREAEEERQKAAGLVQQGGYAAAGGLCHMPHALRPRPRHDGGGGTGRRARKSAHGAACARRVGRAYFFLVAAFFLGAYFFLVAAFFLGAAFFLVAAFFLLHLHLLGLLATSSSRR